jgi:hypothetical protein
LASLFAISSYFAAQNADNTVYAKLFPGNTVSAQITVAQAPCNPNTAILCLNASMANANLQAAVECGGWNA